MKKILLVLMLFFGFNIVSYSQDTQYERYGNARFKFAADVPTGSGITHEFSQNGDGIIINSKEYKITVSGMYNALSETVREAYEREMQYIEGDRGYCVLKKDFYVISYKVSNDIIHYKKGIYNKKNDTFYYLDFEYKASYQKEMDKIINKITKTFKVLN